MPTDIQPLAALWGERVRETRKAKGWTQANLADRCALRQATISDIETGAVLVSDETKVIVAAALRVPVQSLFSFVRPDGE